MESCAAIYWIRNVRNNKWYIGSTSNFARRATAHRSHLTTNRHDNGHLQRAWNKYGAAAFVFEIVERLEDGQDIASIEQWYLDNTRCLNRAYGYNIRPTADKRTISPETRAKMSATRRRLNLGTTHSAERRENIRLGTIGRDAWNKGKTLGPQSDVTKERRSNALKKSWERRKARALNG